MKGVSAVIATILMLLITIALAGTAYLYITGIFTSRSGVVLSVDPSSICGATGATYWINLAIKNDGTGVASNVGATFTSPSGVVLTGAQTNCTTNIAFISGSSINSGSLANAICTRTSGVGTYTVRVTSGSSSAGGTVYCSS